jgi:hypothetical protein
MVEYRGGNDELVFGQNTWFDALGRTTRGEFIGADGTVTSVRLTTYDSEEVDATSTLTIDRGVDGTVDSTTVTTFLPDGRLALETTTSAEDGDGSRTHTWDCSED